MWSKLFLRHVHGTLGPAPYATRMYMYGTTVVLGSLLGSTAVHVAISKESARPFMLMFIRIPSYSCVVCEIAHATRVATPTAVTTVQYDHARADQAPATVSG